MSKALYLNKKDARDIRNLDEIFSRHDITMLDKDLRNDLWAFFRSLRVRLDKAGDTTKAWQKVTPRKTKSLKANGNRKDKV